LVGGEENLLHQWKNGKPYGCVSDDRRGKSIARKEFSRKRQGTEKEKSKRVKKQRLVRAHRLLSGNKLVGTGKAEGGTGEVKEKGLRISLGATRRGERGKPRGNYPSAQRNPVRGKKKG